jgi:hypothetical protein
MPDDVLVLPNLGEMHSGIGRGKWARCEGPDICGRRHFRGRKHAWHACYDIHLRIEHISSNVCPDNGYPDDPNSDHKSANGEPNHPNSNNRYDQLRCRAVDPLGLVLCELRRRLFFP